MARTSACSWKIKRREIKQRNGQVAGPRVTRELIRADARRKVIRESMFPARKNYLLGENVQSWLCFGDKDRAYLSATERAQRGTLVDGRGAAEQRDVRLGSISIRRDDVTAFLPVMSVIENRALMSKGHPFRTDPRAACNSTFADRSVVTRICNVRKCPALHSRMFQQSGDLLTRHAREFDNCFDRGRRKKLRREKQRERERETEREREGGAAKENRKRERNLTVTGSS